MDITIKEHKISFTAEYNIIAEATSYTARKAIFSFNDHLEVKNSSDRVVATVQGIFSPLREKHDFTFADGRSYHFECAQLWRRVFTCTGQTESYTVYEHRGLRCSIFRDDRQIAAFQKNCFVLGKGNEYAIRIDRDVDPLLISCMVLSISLAEDNNDDRDSVTIDFGNIGAEGRTYDETWEPL